MLRRSKPNEVLELKITLELPETEEKELYREKALRLHKQFAKELCVEVWGGPF